MMNKTIREIRQEKGLSVRDVADKLGISPAAYLSAEIFPGYLVINNLISILNVLDVDEDIAIDTASLCDEDDYESIARLALSDE